MSSKFGYQAEIDGLRALAIMSVVLFHAGFTGFSGGYVGVDVFFVISGFLITRLIVAEYLETGSFRFGQFYLRRIRRLFSALFCTVFFSWIGAFLLFSPELMSNFGASAASAILSFSNIYFWSQADYFYTQAITKPLLHTWSLSVEEQFYLIWPAILVFLFSRIGQKRFIVLLWSICIFSIALTHYLFEVDRSAAFYLLPSRVQELGVGALMVWIRPSKNQWAIEWIAFSGFVLIIFSVFAFDNNTLIPGVYSLLPCGGAAALIYGAGSRYIGGLLRVQPLVLIGRMSYSLYLVHWPVIVFCWALTYQQPNGWLSLSIVICSFVLGWIQYRFVEERFRYQRENSWAPGKTALVAFVLSLLIVGPSYYVYANGGLPWRIPESRLGLTNKQWRELERDRYCNNWSLDKDEKLFSCQNFRGKSQDIYIWGDSHALHLVAGFSEVYPDYNIFVIFMNGCVPQSGFNGYVRSFGSAKTQECVERNLKAQDFFVSTMPTNIVITGTKRETPRIISEATKVLVDPLRKAGHRVVILGDFIRPGVPLNHCVAVPHYFVSDLDIRRRCVGNIATVEQEQQYNQELAQGISQVILPDEIQCPDGVCMFLHNGKLLYRDHHHLSIIGSIYFIEQLKRRLPF